jgi:hypothetical protein
VADKKDYQVKIKIGDAEIEVHGAESGVVKIVEALSDVLRGSRRLAAPVGPGQSPASLPAAVAQRSPGATDIRSFFEEKKPSSDIEAAAVAAYYNQYMAADSHRRDTIDSASLQEAFRMARRPLPAKTIWTLTNARNAGYLDSVGEGEFRINPVGYNLVEHGLGSLSEVQVKQAKRGRRPAKKKKKAKTAS